MFSSPEWVTHINQIKQTQGFEAIESYNDSNNTNFELVEVVGGYTTVFFLCLDGIKLGLNHYCRVDKDVRFDSVYMEDIGGDKARKLVPTMVKIMVTPGFYVYDNVVKCKVICRY
ncbi:hypothetical protein Leryth_000367 [Lithospermum erythrorhizon]|nr:hypothetical protein Leryth_000367 [Lithospermum erythrorhizon]